MNSQTGHGLALALLTLVGAGVTLAAEPQSSPSKSEPGMTPAFLEMIRQVVPRTLEPLPLYDGPIPGAIAGPNNETQVKQFNFDVIQRVSLPQIFPYLPAPVRANRTAVLIFPGGGYEGLVFREEGTRVAEAMQDRGIAAFVVKYRLPTDATMHDKLIGPLQDAQRAIQMVRAHAAEWNIDPARVGVMGFSAGGHLASSVGTHFSTSYIQNPDKVNLRPDFMILVFPVITMDSALTHPGSRLALLGPSPTRANVALFSNEKQVSGNTPPTMLIAATDDSIVPIENSIKFYEALRSQHVSAELDLLSTGEHGFILIRDQRWLDPMWQWLGDGGWLAKPKGP